MLYIVLILAPLYKETTNIISENIYSGVIESDDILENSNNDEIAQIIKAVLKKFIYKFPLAAWNYQCWRNDKYTPDELKQLSINRQNIDKEETNQDIKYKRFIDENLDIILEYMYCSSINGIYVEVKPVF